MELKAVLDACQEQTVMLFDAESDEDMIRIARALKRKGFGSVCAGCAGFANETGASRVFLKAPFFHENFSHPFYGAGSGVLFLT